MEFVTIAVDKLLGYTLLPIAQQVGYVIFYKKNVAELKEQARKLLLERESVQHRVDDAKRNLEEIEGVVLDWQRVVDEIASKAKNLFDEDNKRHKTNVDEIEGMILNWPSDIASKAMELLDEDDKRQKNAWCFNRLFPNMCWRHQLSRKAKKLAQEIIDINSKKELSHVSYRGELRITEGGPSSITNGEAFESRVLALNQVMEALADPNLSLIGVYGLGGVGKTTIVHEVAKKAKEKSSDLKVVIVTVKQNPEIKEIQQQIAEMLQLELKEQTPIVRATLLRQKLEQEKNILVILDDLWRKLDLNTVGIPYGKENKNCKILMTSRNRDVLSDQMNTQKNFWLRELADSEAWELFKEKAGINESSKSAQLLSVARDVISECAGLPIAIVTVASSLKRKKISEWKYVLQQLRNHHYSDITARIEVSYQNLENDMLKSIFVLAGVITSSSTMDLFKYCCGMGLFHDMNKMEDMLDGFETCIRKLKDSCLLQSNDNSSSHFTMHDVVRDAAMLIASKGQFFLKINDKLGEEYLLKDDMLKSCKAIFLDCCHIEKLLNRLDCPNLTFFHLHNNNPSLKLPDNFFIGIPALKVLVLTKMNFEFLPSSINLLSNLHTLCFDRCILGDIERIGELNDLKILSFNGSKLEHLPKKLGQLSKLQLLDLSDCSKHKLFPPGVLSNLKMLEILLIGGNSFDQWAVGDQQSTSSLEELNDLSHLNSLVVKVHNENMLPMQPFFEKLQLQRYNIIIGDDRGVVNNSDFSKTLSLDLRVGIDDSKNYFRGLLDHVEALYLRNFKGAKNVVPRINERGLLELKHLRATCNDELQLIVDSVGHRDLFPNLELLELHMLSNFVNICNSSLTKGSFSKLKVVKVLGCHKMKSLFSFSLARCLPQLNTIDVYGCKLLEVIVTDEGKVVGMLQHPNLRTLKVESVPALVGFCSEHKTSSHAQQNKTKHIEDRIYPSFALFSNKVIFPTLETLWVTNANELNNIWDWQGQQFDGLSFRNLKVLVVKCCNRISKVLPCNGLENLEELEVFSCDSLEVIFDSEEATKEWTHFAIKSSSRLRKLSLYNLPNLKHVWIKDSQEVLDFQCLSMFEVSVCHKLKYLFPLSVAKTLTKLQELRIERCRQLETIVGWKDESPTDVSISLVFPRVTSLYLENVPKLRRFYSGTYSIEWPQLQELHYVSVNIELNIFGTGFLDTSIGEHLSAEQAILNLKRLEVDNEAMMIWLKQFPAEPFNKLEHLTLTFFNDANTRSLYPFLQKMSKLEILVLKNSSCKEIFSFEKMGSEENQNSTVVPAKILHLTELHKLRQIFKEGQKLDQCLKNLEELYVNECSSLLNLGPSLITFNLLKTLKVKYCKQLLYLMASVTKNLDQLEELEIEYCGMIKEIIVDNIVIDAETIDEITFSKLKSLKLYALPKLECFCSMNYIFKFPSLEVVIITQCPKMKIFSRRAPNTPKLREVKDNYRSDDGYWERDLNFTVQKLYIDKLYYQLEDLSLSEYPELKQIWHNQLPHGSFRKLNTLTISSCEWSSKVLPLNVLKCLVNLVELKVECCKLVEVVFDLKEDTDEKKDSVILKKLLRLTLTSLPNLKHVWNEDPQGILDFPELYDLTLVDVPKPEHLSIEKAFPNLKGMKVDKAVMTWLGQFPEDHFNKLQYLILTFFNDANTRFPYAFLQKMSKLNDLVILDSSFEEIFPIENEAVGENQHGVALNPTLKSLENLYIKNCSSLLNLVPSTTTFNLLKRLIVEKCEKLLYLIAPSTAKSLGQLEQLQIIECGMMKEIIIDKLYDAEITDEITFSKLHRLELENLPSLECFCSMKYVFNFPSLCEVYIRQCPKMKMFSNGVTSTPKLYSVRHDDPYGPINGYWEDDLNSTVQMMHRDQVASESKDHSSLDVDTNIKNEQLNEPDWNHRVTDEKVKESKREEEHKEYGEVKVGIKIMNVIEKSTTSCLGSRDTNLQTSENQEDQISEHERDCKGKSSERPSIGDIKNATSSSLDSFVEEPMSELVFKGHQAELEQNQVTNEFLDRTDATSEVLHSTIELINNSLSIFSTSKELQHVDRSSTIPQSFSSIANAAELSIGCALEEAFDQKKGTSEIEMIQMKLALESNDKEDSHPQHSSEDTLASSPDIGIHHQNKESILCGQNGKGNNHGEDKEGVVPNQGNKDIDVITVAFPLSRLRLCIISLYLSCFVLLGCYFLLACWGSGMPLVSIPPTFPFQNKESTLVGQNGKSNSLGEGKDGTIQEGVMPGKYDGTVVSPLSRLQLCAIALSFSCLALMGCYFLSAHRGSRMPSVSVSPSFPIVKDTIELNKDQIYLLREAFARYPNLGAPQEDFSPRFHGWGYKTLADLLHFLKTENHVTITKEREKEFHMLCNEAIHFGFDKIWVEEMRKRVVEDPEVDHAQKRFFEILEKEKELRREKEMLNEFLQGRKKKCFDFL